MSVVVSRNGWFVYTLFCSMLCKHLRWISILGMSTEYAHMLLCTCDVAVCLCLSVPLSALGISERSLKAERRSERGCEF